MKKLIYAYLSVGACLVSCDEKAPQPPQQHEPQPPQLSLPPVPEEPPAAPAQPEGAPTDRAVLSQLLPELSAYPAVQIAQLQQDATPAEDGSLLITARVQLLVAENLYMRESAPEAFDVERRAVNAAINRAMMPEAYYLLQVGAEASEIAEEDRRVRPLPEDLKTRADAIRALAEEDVYHLHTPAGTRRELPASVRARFEDGQWVFSELSFDTAALRPLCDCLPESALPAEAAVVKDGFVQERRAEIRRLIDEFNQAAQPTILAREDATRTRMLEARARRDEDERRSAEQDARKAAAREAWAKLCSAYIVEGTEFVGEWKRGERFGKMSLRLGKTQSYPESVQFIGTLADPNLPQAELQVVGRMEQAAQAGEPAPVSVQIYNGRYDPDAPTAEVFDAADGLLRLHMAEDGTLTGVLTCEAWGNDAERAFEVTLVHVARKQTPKRSSRSKSGS